MKLQKMLMTHFMIVEVWIKNYLQLQAFLYQL